MTSVAIKKQLNNYLPLLTIKQQMLLLDMAKNILQVEPTTKRITSKQYNKELNASIQQAKAGKTTKHAHFLAQLK